MCVPSQVPQDMVLQLCGSYSEAELSPPGPALSELRQAHAAGMSLSIYMEESVQELLRDAAERFKGWTTVPGPQRTELACKKVSTTLPTVAVGLGGGVVQARGSATPKEGVSSSGARISFGDHVPELPSQSPTPGVAVLVVVHVHLPLCFHHCCPATWPDLPQALYLPATVSPTWICPLLHSELPAMPQTAGDFLLCLSLDTSHALSQILMMSKTAHLRFVMYQAVMVTPP